MHPQYTWLSRPTLTAQPQYNYNSIRYIVFLVLLLQSRPCVVACQANPLVFIIGIYRKGVVFVRDHLIKCIYSLAILTEIQECFNKPGAVFPCRHINNQPCISVRCVYLNRELYPHVSTCVVGNETSAVWGRVYLHPLLHSCPPNNNKGLLGSLYWCMR